MAVKKPASVSLRTYQVGFGDCFLLGFHYSSNDNRYVLIDFGSTGLPKKNKAKFNDAMKQIADDIAMRCGRKNGKGGSLHAVIATHRHADHINGFATKAKKAAGDESGDVIRFLKPKFVVQPWTEDPKLAPKALGPKGVAPSTGPRRFTASLAGMQSAAGGIAKEAARLDARRTAVAEEDRALDEGPQSDQDRRRRRLAYIGTIQFLGLNNIGNRSAVENLIAMGKSGKALYLHADSRANLGLPGVKVRVLGPPTLKQSTAIRKQRSRDDTEFWMIQGATGATFTASLGTPFPSRGCVKGAKVPDFARWFRDRVRAARAENLYAIVRALDKQMNNTSLILVLDVGKARLLFPGDAQIENWEYSLGKPVYQRLLAGTTLYKVGHHGSRNATPKENLWAKFQNRSTNKSSAMWSFMSTMAGKHGTTESTRVPRKTLVLALEHETNFRSTQTLKSGKVPLSMEYTIDPKTGSVKEAGV
jgi:hypothetical protein